MPAGSVIARQGKQVDRDRQTPVELRSFGRRRGRKLSSRQDALLRDLLPRVGIDLVAATRSLTPSPLWLEIGFGGGEHLVWQAERNPGCPAHRLRAVRGGRGQGARRDRGPEPRQHPPACRRRATAAALAAGGLGRPRVHPVSRSLAEEEARQAPPRLGRDAGAAGPCHEARRRAAGSAPISATTHAPS